MPFNFDIPGPSSMMSFSLEPGSSMIFVGANGGGKTRLAVQIEKGLNLRAHRISAHRALALNPAVAKISEREALFGLRTGYANVQAQEGHREGHRWRSQAAVSLLNDFDYLVQALFADQANKSLETHKKVRTGYQGPAEPTKFERLVEIWQRLLPHRQLHISGDDIEVAVGGGGNRYKASEMSDGERAIFYTIGQTLAAAADSLLILDEPELHIHPSIMSKLWDELEASRPDCGFVFITHDLVFASSRVAQKFVIKDYDPQPKWTIEAVPEQSGFDEALTTLILGSRRPILFVEGTESSLDSSIYRCVYPDWTVVPRNSCEEVIHSVATFRRSRDLTRITCSGIVDGDGYEPEDIARLNDLGISVLPVAEIENVLLIPSVSRAIADTEGYKGADLDNCLNSLRAAAFAMAQKPGEIDAAAVRCCRRRIDRLLKRIDLGNAMSVADLTAEYRARTSGLDVAKIANEVTARIQEAIRTNDLSKMLAQYDNKGLMALAAQYLKRSKLRDFESWITRVLRNDRAPAVVTAIQAILPKIVPK